MDPERWKNLQFADTYLPTRDVSKQKENAQIMQRSKHLAIPLCIKKTFRVNFVDSHYQQWNQSNSSIGVPIKLDDVQQEQMR